MNKVFCSSCGYKNVYEVTKPKFCADCGVKIGLVTEESNRGAIQVEASYDNSVSKSFDLQAMKNDIDVDVNTQQLTLTDVWKSATPSDVNNKFTRRKPNLPDGEEILKQSLADCAPSRVQDIDG